MPKGKMYKLANGEPVEVVSKYNDRIVVLYNGARLDRPADIIGRVIFPAEDAVDVSLSETEKHAQVNSFKNSKSPDHMRRKVIHPGDTVCIKFIETGRKAVYTLTSDEKNATVVDVYPDEGIVSEKSPLGIALLGMGTNDIVTFYDADRVIVIQILSFFLKKEGMYQRMKEQKDAQKMLEHQKKKRKTEEKVQKTASKIRTIRTGDTVCIEFLDTKEKKAFKIVQAWVEVHGGFAAKPYRPMSYDSKTITDANPDEDTISETSPLARAVIGKKRGDIAAFTVGSHKTQVRIIAFFNNDAWLQKQKNLSSDS
ncbi:MAG: GreA/GreB family elongation factor [Clostridia bacterium]|nr:GreA/GreB family elongation factor [Clostridia bacterium]